MLTTRSVRGPASYVTGGFNVTMGSGQKIADSSGRVAAAWTSSSSPFVAQVVNSSGNIITVMLRDTRSSGIEAGSAVDFSNLHVMAIADVV